MEKLHICEKCKKPILKVNEILSENVYYHKKCLNPEPQKDSDEVEKTFALEKAQTKFLKKKYSDLYFGKTLITEVVRPYLEFKYKITKNIYLDLLPQVSMYFNDIDEEKAKEFVKNGGMEKLKEELSEILGEEISISFSRIIFGSLFAKFSTCVKKIKNLGKKGIEKLNNFFKKGTQVVKNAIDILRNKKFKCIEGLQPSSIKFVNQKDLEDPVQNEKQIKDFLKQNYSINNSGEEILPKKMLNMSLDDNINEAELETAFEELEHIAQNEEKELGMEISNIQENDKFNKELNNHLEKAFKESIFEFKIKGIAIVNKGKQREIYEKNKSECPNVETKILFHATQIDFSSKILTSNFLVGKDNWYGIGVYFADQFDYVKYYCSKDDFALIPKLNDSFSIVVSEVYYDKTKLRQIYDMSLHVVLPKYPTEEELKSNKYKNYIVEKNGIHYAEVDGGSGIVFNKNKIIEDDVRNKLPENRFVGREYCITSTEQIIPLYGLNFQRVDTCIIWRDSNFNSPMWREPLENNKELIKEMTGYRLYTECDTQSALKLVWRKKYNKIILITNVGKNLEGKKFVDKVRKIVGFNIMVLFFTNDLRHLEWIKDYPNSLFCADDYTIKKYVFNFGLEVFKEIRNNVKEFYGVELQEPKDALTYPLFELYKDTYNFYADLDCSEYKDIE